MTQAAAVSENNTATLSEAQKKKMANAIRFLTLDAIKAANSGHSGMPMGITSTKSSLAGMASTGTSGLRWSPWGGGLA